ncbi:MAG: sulfurtransferase [Promethearchaeati archaeon SRVP18_Atabeyarchaeia-1]
MAISINEGAWDAITERIYPCPSGKASVKLVSTSWLDEHLDDDGLMIVDAQPDLYDYVQQHIPGASYLSERILRASLGGLPARYISLESIQSILRNIGVKADLPIVVYTGTGAFKVQGDGAEQFMVAYTLARFGHDKIYVLDGGIDKWKEEGRKLTKIFPRIKESRFKGKVNHDLFVEYEEFKRIKDQGGVLHLDTRPSKYYEGEGPWIRLGHIPGAVNLPWTELVDEKNSRLLRSDSELKTLFERHGASPDKSVILSCGTGRHATVPFFLLKWYFGYPKVRIFEGSFTEWTSYRDNPTLTGKSQF